MAFTSPVPRMSATRLGLGEMNPKSIFVGRMEKRMPIAIVVLLVHAQTQAADGGELTYTHNISLHGASVASCSPWQIGEEAQVTSFKDESMLSGKVVYCRQHVDGRYLIGLSFQDRRVTWSAYRLYRGTCAPPRLRNSLAARLSGPSQLKRRKTSHGKPVPSGPG